MNEVNYGWKAEFIENNDIDGIKDYMFQKEMQYYEWDMSDLVIPLAGSVDCPLESLGLRKSPYSNFYSDVNVMCGINT